MRPDETIVVSGGQTFTLNGGTYGFDVNPTVSAGGSVQLQRLGPDSATYENVGTSVGSGAAASYQTVQIPQGGYKLAVTSGSERSRAVMTSGTNAPAATAMDAKKMNSAVSRLRRRVRMSRVRTGFRKPFQ